MEQKKQTNELELNELDIHNPSEDVDDGSPISNTTPGDAEEIKEFVLLEFADGSKIHLGSCTSSILELCQLSIELKSNLFNNGARGTPKYTG